MSSSSIVNHIPTTPTATDPKTDTDPKPEASVVLEGVDRAVANEKSEKKPPKRKKKKKKKRYKSMMQEIMGPQRTDEEVKAHHKKWLDRTMPVIKCTKVDKI